MSISSDTLNVAVPTNFIFEVDKLSVFILFFIYDPTRSLHLYYFSTVSQNPIFCFTVHCHSLSSTDIDYI